jgi:penicillin-binding protein 1A
MELVRLYIDKKTGKVASPGAKGSELMFFKKGTEPKDAVPDKNQVDVDTFMMGSQ